jgi:hypothetical protein
MEFTQRENHKMWTAAKRTRERERAERIGQLEKFVSESRITPTVAVVGFFAVMGAATTLIESIKL